MKEIIIRPAPPSKDRKKIQAKFNIDSEVHSQLEVAADTFAISKSQLVEQALIHYLDMK